VKLISCQNGRILTSLQSEEEISARAKIVSTGLHAIDSLTPDGGFAQGAIHELLSDQEPARSFALFLTCNFSGTGAIVWSDPDSEIYPPAIQASGIPLNRLYLLRPAGRQDLIWSISECLSCKGVAVTVAVIDRLSRIEARRLQLSAERGGGIGLLLRPMLRSAGGFAAPSIYAAATRWLVAPAPGERTVQRWEITLIHGHGGCLGKPVLLEHCRETNLVRAAEKLADRSVETQEQRLGA